MTQIDLNERPRPLLDAAGGLVKTLGVAGALVTALVGWGVVTLSQGDAVHGLLGAIPGVVALVTDLLVAFGIVRRAEPQVTPLSDPRDAAGRPMRSTV